MIAVTAFKEGGYPSERKTLGMADKEGDILDTAILNLAEAQLVLDSVAGRDMADPARTRARIVEVILVVA